MKLIVTKNYEELSKIAGVDMEAYAEKVNAPYWKFCKWDFPEE